MSCASPSGTRNSHASPSKTCTLTQPLSATFFLACRVLFRARRMALV
jgi:hypothetical protein